MRVVSQLSPLPSVGQQARSQCPHQGKMRPAAVTGFLGRLCNQQTGTTDFPYSSGTLWLSNFSISHQTGKYLGCGHIKDVRL